MEEFSIQIIRNDVEHLEKNMKTFSQQLRILQDFIKLEFGLKFQEFYSQQLSLIATGSQGHDLPSQYRHPHSSGTNKVIEKSSNATIVQNSRYDISQESQFPIPTTTKDDRTFIPPTIINHSTDNNINIDNGEQEVNMDQIHIKPEVFEIPYSEDEGDLHENNEEEYIYENGQDPLDSSTSSFHEDPEYTHENSREKGSSEMPKSRRQKNNPEIFKHFILKSTWSKAECRKCGVHVSNRNCRLKAHLALKCLAVQQGMYARSSQLPEYPATEASSTTTTTFVRTPNNNASNEIGIRSSSSATPWKSKAAIRQFFTTCNIDGIIKSKCLRCGKLVSNKPLRLKSHYDVCVKIGNDSSSGNIDMNDDSFTFDGESSSSGFIQLHHDERNISNTLLMSQEDQKEQHLVNQSNPTIDYNSHGFILHPS